MIIYIYCFDKENIKGEEDEYIKLHTLSVRMRVTRGKRMEMPSAECEVDLLNSAPVISHTYDREGDRES